MSATPDVAALALRVQLASFAGPSLPPDWAALLADGLGGICLFGSNLTGTAEDVAVLVAAVRAAGPRALVALDEEGGDVTRLHTREASPVPGAAVLGAVDDLDLTRAVGAAVGAELASLGIDLDLGPVADVNSNPDNPVIGTRSFGADPARVGRHVAAWVEGLQAEGVAACVKHFPGHGDTAQDSHLTLPVLAAPADVVRARELRPFAAAVAGGAAAVMTSHLLVPALDPDHPATLSAPVLGLLRDELGFDGAIVSDALDMAGASASRGIPEAAVLALAAGCDLLCIGPDKDAGLVREVQAAIVTAVDAGRLPLARLTDAATRIADLPRSGGLAGTKSPGCGVEVGRLAAAARAACLVEGPLPDLTGAGARVVSVATEANIAVGPGRWGLVADLEVAAGEPLPDGALVVQVRDAHRRPEVAAALAAHPGPLVVVEWGWPGPRTGWAHAPHARICTQGNGQPSIAAVTEILREAGLDR
ncbi:glycoside hydrolase [Pimelobacter simplex]|uniref:Beta-hexosaminidase n=1 Tax=Nocardioides simplex TaxID=2045 RepID=A0A0A1DPU9_NOCSI|nr:glycoside hydrolase family 3 N-terminal domain-containing protein [Pimelobacter simplex]AIY18632.1 Beta-hexosaminidase [Pimelobacter simplex]MCG8153171.1 glycoside hydrolase [Pimelobacter simplex]GEB14287.1 sugar hydrolase [Pimelobacter simplex]SFM31486.1 beta-N-acetylhexosaminidase [Pimelobacter simplex]